MGDNIVASMSATIDIDKQETLNQLITFSKEAQAYTDKHKITYKFTSDKSDLARVVKEIEGLSPEIRAGVVLDFDKADYNKKLDQLNTYAAQTASDIGKNFKSEITKELKNMNLQSILDDQFGAGAKATKTNLRSIFNDLYKQTQNFDIAGVKSLDDITNQVTALKQLTLVLQELQSKGDVNVGKNINIADSLKSTEAQLTNIFNNAGEVIYQNASSWAVELTKAFQTQFGNIETFIRNFVQGVNTTFGSGISGASVNLEEIEKQINEQEKALEKAEQQAQKYNDILSKPVDLSKLKTELNKAYEGYEKDWSKAQASKFQEAYQKYVGLGGTPENRITVAYQATKDDNKAGYIKVKEIQNIEQAAQEANAEVERLRTSLASLREQAKNAPISTGEVPGSSSGSTAQAPDVSQQTEEQIAEIKVLKEQLDLVRANLSLMTEDFNRVQSELGETKTQASGLAQMLAAAEEQGKELATKLSGFDQGQVPVTEFNKLQSELSIYVENLTKLQVAFDSLKGDLSASQSENERLREQMESQKEEISLAQQYKDQLSQGQTELQNANKTIQEQTVELDKVRARYDEICDRLETINKFLNNMRKHDADGLQVATDALNKEYTEASSEYQKDKAAIYYGQYLKNGGTEKLYQNGVDVSSEIIKRYNAILKERNQLRQTEQKEIQETMFAMQAAIRIEREKAAALKKANDALKEKISLLEEAERAEKAMAKAQASTTPTPTAQPSPTSSTTPIATVKPTKPSKTQSDTPVASGYPTAEINKDSDGTLTRKVKLVPDATTFKPDAEKLLKPIVLDKKVELKLSDATANDQGETTLNAIQGTINSLLESIDNIDFNKLQVSKSTLDNLTTLSYILETLKSLISDIQALNIGDVLNNKALSGIKFTKESSDALDAIVQSLPTLNNALINFGSVQDTIQGVEDLTNKIAILKGVVDNLKDIKVEIIETKTANQPKVKVNGRANQPQNPTLSSVLQQTKKDYDAIAEAARKVNPEISKTVKVVQKLRRDEDGRFAQSFVVSDEKGNSATVNKAGKYYLGTSVVRDDIAEANAEQKALNDSIKEYEQHLKEIQALDAKNNKTRESNATYILSEQLKSMEKIAKIKADIIKRESQGKDTSILEKKLFLEKQYCNSLATELEYYKGTVAYQERITAKKNKSKENELVVDDAKALARQKDEDKAWQKKVADQKRARKQARKKEAAEAKAELELQRQLSKEEEAQSKEQYKKGQAFLGEDKIYQNLLDTIKQYEDVSKRISSGKTLAGDIELAEQLEAKISDLQKHPILSTSQIEESERKLVQLFNQLDVLEKKLAQSNDAKEGEAQANAQYKKGQAFLNEEQKRVNQELLDTIQRYGEVQKRVSGGKTLEGDLELTNKLETKISDLQKSPILSPDQIEESERRLDKLLDQLVDIENSIYGKKSKGKQLSYDYESLENVLSQKNALQVKSIKDGVLSPNDQQKLNDLLIQENKLRNSINDAFKLGVTNKKAYVHLTEKEKVLQDTLSSTVYKNLENTLLDIDKLESKKAKNGLSTKEQLKLNKLLEDKTRLLAIIEDYQKRGIKNTEAELSLKKTISALSGESVFNIQSGNYKSSYEKAIEIDARQFIDIEAIKEAQLKLSDLYKTMTDGAKRSAADNEQLSKEFKEQVEIIEKLTKSAYLRNRKDGSQYVGKINPNQSIVDSKYEILDLLEQTKMGAVTFDTFTKGHQGMIVSIKGSDNQIRKYKISLDQATGAITSLYLSEKKYTSFGSRWIAGVKKKIVELSQYMSGIQLLTRAWNSIKQGVNIVKELDTALTEMRKVSDETVLSLKRFQKESFNIADSVGTTASEIQNSTADFMRLGESIKDAAKSAETSNILFKVSEFESIDEATNSLVSMSQAYQELEKIDIVDKLNNIGNNFAISTDGLATALQNSASALKTAKNDLDESIALATAGNAVVQDPDKVGAGLRTIALRITGTESAKEELQSLGEDVDDFVVTTSSKLNQQVIDLTKTTNSLGVSLLDANGNYRSTYEILQDIADVWETIAEEDLDTGENRQNALLELLAGKNRSNILASILQNPDVLRDAFESAKDSAGSAQEELEKYLDSIDGKINQLTNSVQEFWHTFLDSSMIKGATDFLTSIVKFGTWITETFGTVGTVATVALSAFAITKGGGRAKNSVSLLL